MANLLKETIDFLGEFIRVNSIEECSKRINWAKVNYISSDYQCGRTEDEFEKRSFRLSPTHAEEEALSFLKSLDFEYDDGYGLQEVFGIIMLNDGTWLTRYEYDGSERWDWNEVPSWD